MPRSPTRNLIEGGGGGQCGEDSNLLTVGPIPSQYQQPPQGPYSNYVRSSVSVAAGGGGGGGDSVASGSVSNAAKVRSPKAPAGQHSGDFGPLHTRPWLSASHSSTLDTTVAKSAFPPIPVTSKSPAAVKQHVFGPVKAVVARERAQLLSEIKAYQQSLEHTEAAHRDVIQANFGGLKRHAEAAENIKFSIAQVNSMLERLKSETTVDNFVEPLETLAAQNKRLDEGEDEAVAEVLALRSMVAGMTAMSSEFDTLSVADYSEEPPLPSASSKTMVKIGDLAAAEEGGGGREKDGGGRGGKGEKGGEGGDDEEEQRRQSETQRHPSVASASILSDRKDSKDLALSLSAVDSLVKAMVPKPPSLPPRPPSSSSVAAAANEVTTAAGSESSRRGTAATLASIVPIPHDPPSSSSAQAGDTGRLQPPPRQLPSSGGASLSSPATAPEGGAATEDESSSSHAMRAVSKGIVTSLRKAHHSLFIVRRLLSENPLWFNSSLVCTRINTHALRANYHGRKVHTWAGLLRSQTYVLATSTNRVTSDATKAIVEAGTRHAALVQHNSALEKRAEQQSRKLAEVNGAVAALKGEHARIDQQLMAGQYVFSDPDVAETFVLLHMVSLLERLKPHTEEVRQWLVVQDAIGRPSCAVATNVTNNAAVRPSGANRRVSTLTGAATPLGIGVGGSGNSNSNSSSSSRGSVLLAPSRDHHSLSSSSGDGEVTATQEEAKDLLLKVE